MSGTFTLTRPRRPKSLISMAPMIDVMMIMLVFFMVTSTFLDLNMIPAVQQSDTPAAASAPATDQGKAETLLVRLGADGLPAVQGRSMDGPGFATFLRGRLADAPDTQIVILPSGSANMQALVTVMDIATQSGARSLRVVRLEARP